MNPSIYNPCEDGIAAKVWELLRRNEVFQEKTRELKSLREQGREKAMWSQSRFVNKENNSFAKIAWHWMHVPEIISSESAKKMLRPVRIGPILISDQVQAIKEYREDKRKGRAPLKIDSTWPDTPRGFQNAYKARWSEYTPDPFEIVPSGIYENEDEIPPGTSIAPDLLYESKREADDDSDDAVTYWKFASSFNRLFAIPRVSIRGKSSRKKIIKFITEKLEEVPLAPKVQLFGTEAQWRSFLTVESILKSDSLSRGVAIEKAIVELGYGIDLDPVIRRNRYYSRIQGQVDAIDNSNEDFPDQNGWIQLVYTNIYPLTKIIKIAQERQDSPVRQ